MLSGAIGGIATGGGGFDVSPSSGAHGNKSGSVYGGTVNFGGGPGDFKKTALLVGGALVTLWLVLK